MSITSAFCVVGNASLTEWQIDKHGKCQSSGTERSMCLAGGIYVLYTNDEKKSIVYVLCDYK